MSTGTDMTTTNGHTNDITTAITPGHRPIASDELGRLLHDPDVTIVDVRPSAAYNGWKMNGERRGGHVPGAVSFPHAWIDRLDEAEAGRLLDAKGVLDH